MNPPSRVEPEKEPARHISHHVLVRWDNDNSCYYLGTEISTSKNRSHIIFDFAKAKWIDANRIITVSTNSEQQDLRIGDSIFVEFPKDTPTWVPATVLKVEDDQLHAKLDAACLDLWD